MSYNAIAALHADAAAAAAAAVTGAVPAYDSAFDEHEDTSALLRRVRRPPAVDAVLGRRVQRISLTAPLSAPSALSGAGASSVLGIGTRDAPRVDVGGGAAHVDAAHSARDAGDGAAASDAERRLLEALASMDVPGVARLQLAEALQARDFTAAIDALHRHFDYAQVWGRGSEACRHQMGAGEIQGRKGRRGRRGVEHRHFGSIGVGVRWQERDACALHRHFESIGVGVRWQERDANALHRRVAGITGRICIYQRVTITSESCTSVRNSHTDAQTLFCLCPNFGHHLNACSHLSPMRGTTGHTPALPLCPNSTHKTRPSSKLDVYVGGLALQQTRALDHHRVDGLEQTRALDHHRVDGLEQIRALNHHRVGGQEQVRALS
eukprot:358807-Chlamydomonas_euryale.AAC.1